MVRYKIDVVKALEKKGYSYYYLTKNKILHPEEYKKIKDGELISPKIIKTLCAVLDVQPADLIQFAFEFGNSNKEILIALQENYLRERIEKGHTPVSYEMQDSSDNFYYKHRAVAEPETFYSTGDKKEILPKPVKIPVGGRLVYKKPLLNEFKQKGYSSYRLRQEGIFSNREIQNLREGTVTMGKEFLEKTCLILHCQPGDFLAYEREEGT